MPHAYLAGQQRLGEHGGADGAVLRIQHAVALLAAKGRGLAARAPAGAHALAKGVAAGGAPAYGLGGGRDRFGKMSGYDSMAGAQVGVAEATVGGKEAWTGACRPGPAKQRPQEPQTSPHTATATERGR